MFCVTILSSLLGAIVPHLYLDAAHAKQFLGKWRPQIVAGSIISVTGVNAYANAMIAMERRTCGGALVRFDSAPCMFIVSIDANVTVVQSSMLSAPSDMAVLMDDLRVWHEATFPNSVLIDGQLEDPI